MEKILNVVTSPQIIISAVVVLISCMLWLALRHAYRKYVAVGTTKGEKTTFFRVMFGTLRVLIVCGALLLVLQINGVNVTSAIAGLGLLSAIVGLALQDILKDTIMGIHIMSDHFFAVGDVVKYRDVEGMVIGFTMKTTTLRNIYDQTITTICNRNISEITRMPESVQVDIDLPLSYEENIQQVHVVLREICMQIEKMDGIDRCIYKGTQDFAASAVIYKLRFFCSPEEKPDRTRDAMRLIQTELDQAGLRIPYNQLDVHTIV